MPPLPLSAALIVVGAVTLACGSSDPAPDSPSASAAATVTTGSPRAGSTGIEASDERAGLWPDVLAATIEETGPGVYDLSATLSSPYDSAERYADGWRVVGPDGTVYGERSLAHDHAAEQPFTRSLSGVVIPAGVIEVTIEGRDQVSGWGGATITLTVPDSGP